MATENPFRPSTAFSNRPSPIDSLYRISSLVNQTEDPREALNWILKEIVTVLNATSASVALVNPDTNMLEIEAYEGLPSTAEETHLSIGQGITGWVALHGKPLLVPDVSKESRYIAVKESIRAEMAAPMRLDSIGSERNEDGLTVGVVNVDSDQVNVFDPQDLKLLILLTNEATKVVSRLWLISQLKTKARQLESLVKVGQQLTQKLELHEILQQLTNRAQRLSGYRFSAIFLLDADRETLRLHAISGSNAPEPFSENINIFDSAIGTSVQRKKQVSILNLVKSEEHHFVQLVQQEGLMSALATPILAENRAIGVLMVYTSVLHRFNDDEKNLLSMLAALGSVSIQNAKLYGRVFESEESLRRNERLTTLGLLAAEIAHEIRNPLTVIKLLFESLDLQFPEGDARAQDVEVILERILHLEDIVGNVLSFGKSNTELHSRCNLINLVEDTLRLVRLKLAQSKISLSFTPPTSNLTVEVHRGQIQQVLLNLILNAEHAMGERGGSILIEVVPPAEANGAAQRGLGRLVTVRVRDNGVGIPMKIRDRIFDSFLTSKRDGTGLGLSICKQIVKSHRGNIELVETGSAGTTFEFTLPLA